MVTELDKEEKNAKTFLKENSDVAAEIEESIRSSGQKELIPEDEEARSMKKLKILKKKRISKKLNKTILII